MKIKHISVLAVLVFLISFASISSSAQTDSISIDSYFVSVPACSGFEGRIAFTWTISSSASSDRWLWVEYPYSTVGVNVSSLGPGTYNNNVQFIPSSSPTIALPDGSIVSVTITLSTFDRLVIFDTVTINFVCDTGVIVVPTTPSSPVQAPISNPDQRINWGYGDLDAVVYSQGDGAIIYCYEETAWLAFQITPEIVEAWDTSLPQETPVLEFDDGACRTAFYILDTGEYQINIWTEDGKLYEIIADNLRFENASLRYFDPNE